MKCVGCTQVWHLVRKSRKPYIYTVSMHGVLGSLLAYFTRHGDIISTIALEQSQVYYNILAIEKAF